MQPHTGKTGGAYGAVQGNTPEIEGHVQRGVTQA